MRERNAIGFDNRPFADVTEMNETLIHRWNSVVSRADTVYVLGDFIWEKESLWPAWLERLTGNKVLIRGNHDPISHPARHRAGRYARALPQAGPII